MVAATDTLRDNNVPEAGMLADTRRVWGPVEGGVPGRHSTCPRP